MDFQLYQNQSILEPGPDRVRYFRFGEEDEKICEKGQDKRMMSHHFKDTRTLIHAMQRGLKESNDGKCLGWRPLEKSPYHWLSYSQVLERAGNFGRGLRVLDLEANTMIGLYSKNRPECIIAEYGMYHYSMINVPLYDTLGPDASHFIIEQAQLSTIICEDDEKLNNILNCAPPSVQKLICMGQVKEKTLERAEQMKIKILSFKGVEELGHVTASQGFPFQFPAPDDVCTICYTSGTTGSNPKGAILTHANFIATASSILLNVSAPIPLNPSDCSISFLPLAHVYERETHTGMFMAGASVGYYRGDILKLVDDIQELQPTFLPCVPRLLNKIYDKVINTAKESYVKKFILDTAIHFKSKELERGIVRRDSIWDTLVFGKIQKLFGGKLRFIVSSAAPISKDVLTFFRCAMGCEVFECYGQTESGGSITSTRCGDYDSNHLGPPHPCCAIKLVDIPDMNYYGKNDEGEICIRGHNIFKGYFKNEEETKNVFDEDGWLHTGDVGIWTARGTLRIIDRIKNILKLSQGEYVAPEKIEGIYLTSSYVAQIFVYGHSLKSFLVAIVVPDFEMLKKTLPLSKSICNEKICLDDRAKKLILQDLTKQGKAQGLKSFEQVKDIYLHGELLTIENGLLTPTMKSKRPLCQKYFKPQLDAMYSNIN